MRARLSNNVVEPAKLADGTCLACVERGGWLCEYHQQAGLVADRKRAQVVRLAVQGLQRAELERICARYELESDQFATAAEKAEQVANGGPIPPRY